MGRILAAVAIGGALDVTLTIAGYQECSAAVSTTGTTLPATRQKHEMISDEKGMSFVTEVKYSGIFHRFSLLWVGIV